MDNAVFTPDEVEAIAVDVPVEHLFSDGLYTRTMKVPANTLVVGKRHRHKTLNIMTKGRALITSGEGHKPREIKAPCTFVSEPMVRKVAMFLEDSEWINVHPTEETDLEKIEEKFIISEEEYLELTMKEGDRLCHGSE